MEIIRKEKRHLKKKRKKVVEFSRESSGCRCVVAYFSPVIIIIIISFFLSFLFRSRAIKRLCFSSLGRVCLVVVVVGWLQFSNSWPCSVYLSRSTAKDVFVFFVGSPFWMMPAHSFVCVCVSVSFLVIGVDHTRDSFRFCYFCSINAKHK